MAPLRGDPGDLAPKPIWDLISQGFRVFFFKIMTSGLEFPRNVGLLTVTDQGRGEGVKGFRTHTFYSKVYSRLYMHFTWWTPPA